MKRLALLLGLCFLQYFAIGQRNLYMSNGISSFARWPIIEAGNSVFYLSYTNDTVSGRLINRHFVSSVNKFTYALEHSVQLLADTVFSPYEYQSFPISYSFNPSSKRLNIFFVTDEDSSRWASSTLKEFPKSIYFLQLDTNLGVVVPKKQLVHFYGNDRYALRGLNLSIPISGDRTCLSYTVRDTFIDGLVVSTADKFLIVDDTGKLLRNQFLAWEPLGDGPYFASHFTNGDIYKHPGGKYAIKGTFQDSIGQNGSPLLFVLDSNFELIDTFDNSYDESLAVQPPGKHIYFYGNFRETYIFLPTGSLISSSVSTHNEAGNPRMSSYYAVAKASALTRYKPKLMYLPPKSDTLDYQHEATLNFFPTIFSSSDNRLYLFSSTESEPLANFCVNGKGNLGQITALDTFLNEKWVKYVHPRSGHCIKSFCIAPCAGRKGLLVSGLEFPLSDPDNQTLWKAFIYHVDSSTSLGIDADHPVSITSQFYLSPNPATDFVAINNALGDPFTYSLTGTNGQIISEGNGQNTSTKLSLSNLSPGFYLVTIKSKTGQLHHLKFIRQ